MDLTSAEKSAQKILDYIQTVVNSDSRLYTKSKYKLHHISNTCLQIVSMCSKLIENDILEADDVEFGSTVDPQFVSMVHNICDTAEKLSEFLPESNSTKKYPVAPSDAKEVIKSYKFVLSQLSDLNTPNKCVNKCIDIINRWFVARILTQYNHPEKFKYNIFRIKNIIYSIIILYGKHVDEGTVDEFESLIDSWIDKLSYVPESSRWIAPYEVYEVEKVIDHLPKEYANLTSMIIFDVIWDLGAQSFKRKTILPDAYVDCKEFWRILSSSDQSVLDDYEYYGTDESDILEKHNIK